MRFICWDCLRRRPAGSPNRSNLFQRADHENPRSAKYFVNLGLSLGGMGLGRTREALEALRKAVAIDPTIPAAWSNLGNEFRTICNLRKPSTPIRKRLRLKPDFADAQCNLGAALQEHLPTLGPAIAAYERAICAAAGFRHGSLEPGIRPAACPAISSAGWRNMNGD